MGESERAPQAGAEAYRCNRDDLRDPASGVYSRTSIPPPPLSQQLWGTDWRAPMPWRFSKSGIVAVPGVAADCLPFIASNFPQLVDSSGAPTDGPIADARRRFIALSDCIELRHEGETVGVFIGAPEDWSTYYHRILCVLPEYQSPIMLRLFGQQVLKHLAAIGVERYCADTSPTNTAMANYFHKMGFVITGQRVSERWGTMIRYTKYLDDRCSRAFTERFG